MIVAITIWDGRVSPVFDTAQELCIGQVEGNVLHNRTMEYLKLPTPEQRIERICALKVNVLICGAISRPLAARLNAVGIQLISFVAGNVEDILSAYLQKRLPTSSFAMPGCGRGQGHRLHHRHGNCGAKPKCATQQTGEEGKKCRCLDLEEDTLESLRKETRRRQF